MEAGPRRERALPVLAGILLALAFPPAAFLLPSFVGLVPLLVFIATRPPGPAGRRQATTGALVTGLVFFGLRLLWFLVALAGQSVLALPAYATTVLLLTATLGLFGWALHLVLEGLPRATPLPVAVAVLWGALEWIHGHLGPIAFPWFALATGLAPFPRLAGAADLVGASGLGVWLAAVNGALAALLLRSRRGVGTDRETRWAMAGTALLVAAPILYGVVRAATLDVREAAVVAIVQTDVPERSRLGRAAALDSALTSLAAGTAGLAGTGVDLVVWPEVALPIELGSGPAGSALLDSVAALSRRAAAPIVVGAYGAGLGGRLHNSAFLVDGFATESPVARYDKRRLVPFIERVPFRGGRTPAYYGGLAPGSGPVAPLPAKPAAAGVLICFESIFPGAARARRRAGAEMLVNITNDGWYGRPAWYGRTTALWQHPAHLALRAIETRTGAVRAANRGFSFFVDPIGRVHDRAALFEPAVLVAAVRTTTGSTPFVRMGDVAGPAAAGAALLLVAAAGARRSRGRAAV